MWTPPYESQSQRWPPLIACLPHAACSWLLLSVCPFTIDDTGCPTSQSVSPSKTPSGSERSSRGSPVLPERKAKVKRVRVMAEWSGEPRSTQRHKRELRSAMKARGKDTHRSANDACQRSLAPTEITAPQQIEVKRSSSLIIWRAFKNALSPIKMSKEADWFGEKGLGA